MENFEPATEKTPSLTKAKGKKKAGTKKSIALTSDVNCLEGKLRPHNPIPTQNEEGGGTEPFRGTKP